VDTAALALVKAAAGDDAWLEAFDGPERFDAAVAGGDWMVRSRRSGATSGACVQTS
jgi:hypothetical protein